MPKIPKPVEELSLYLYQNVIDDITEDFKLTLSQRRDFSDDIIEAIFSGALRVRDPISGKFIKVTKQMKEIPPFVKEEDVTKWLEESGYHYTWTPRLIIKYGEVSYGTDKIKIGLTSRQIASNFGGIYFAESAWRKNLGSPPIWLKKCLLLKGKRSQTQQNLWDPVLIARHLILKEKISVQDLDPIFILNTKWIQEWRLLKSTLK